MAAPCPGWDCCCSGKSGRGSRARILLGGVGRAELVVGHRRASLFVHGWRLPPPGPGKPGLLRTPRPPTATRWTAVPGRLQIGEAADVRCCRCDVSPSGDGAPPTVPTGARLPSRPRPCACAGDAPSRGTARSPRNAPAPERRPARCRADCPRGRRWRRRCHQGSGREGASMSRRVATLSPASAGWRSVVSVEMWYRLRRPVRT